MKEGEGERRSAHRHMPRNIVAGMAAWFVGMTMMVLGARVSALGFVAVGFVVFICGLMFVLVNPGAAKR